MANKQLWLNRLAGALLMAAGIGVALVLATLPQDIAKRPPVEVTKFVNAEPVVYNTIATALEASGRVVSAQPITLIAEVQGRILAGEVPLKAGQSFTKGQVLYAIDDAEARYNLLARKSSFMTSVAGVIPDFRIDYPASVARWEKFFAAIDIERALPELPEISSTKEKTFLSSRDILNTYYSIKADEERLLKYAVQAPYAGSIAEVLLETGSVATPGSRIAHIIRTDNLELEVPIGANDIKWIGVGADVRIFDESGAREWRGTVRRIGRMVQSATQSIPVYVRIKNKIDQPVFDGMYLKVEIPGKTLENVMEIPRNAVDNSDEVFVVTDGKLKTTIVEIHKIKAETVLFSGLDEGEYVVIDPMPGAREGLKVSVIGQEDTDENEQAVQDSVSVTTTIGSKP